MLTWDICNAGCCVFAGILNAELRCPNCSLLRFKDCYQCGAKDYEYCIRKRFEVHDEKRSFCNRRAAVAVVEYRPLIPLLISLIEDKEFRRALQFQHDDVDYMVIRG